MIVCFGKNLVANAILLMFSLISGANLLMYAENCELHLSSRFR